MNSLRVVVSDTGPLHYLVLVQAIEILPHLFGRVLIPELVSIELRHPRTPAPVRAWMESNPGWMEIRTGLLAAALSFPKLGDGERAAIALAQAAEATLVLIDDRAAVTTARSQALAATGTLGVLELAAMIGLIDLGRVLTRLKATNFRYRPELLDALLARHRDRAPSGS